MGLERFEIILPHGVYDTACSEAIYEFPVPANTVKVKAGWREFDVEDQLHKYHQPENRVYLERFLDRCRHTDVNPFFQVMFTYLPKETRFVLDPKYVYEKADDGNPLYSAVSSGGHPCLVEINMGAETPIEGTVQEKCILEELLQHYEMSYNYILRMAHLEVLRPGGRQWLSCGYEYPKTDYESPKGIVKIGWTDGASGNDEFKEWFLEFRQRFQGESLPL